MGRLHCTVATHSLAQAFLTHGRQSSVGCDFIKWSCQAAAYVDVLNLLPAAEPDHFIDLTQRAALDIAVILPAKTVHPVFVRSSDLTSFYMPMADAAAPASLRHAVVAHVDATCALLQRASAQKEVGKTDT